MKFRIKTQKQIYFIFAIISLLIAGIVTFFIKSNNLPYDLKVVQKAPRRSSKYVYFYKDLNNDGISEKFAFVSLQKPINDNLIVYKGNLAVLDQFNTFAHSDPTWINALDYNNDGYKDIFMFSQLNDSLFLSIIDVKSNKYILQHQPIMSKPDSAITEQTKTWDIQAIPFTLLTSKNPKSKELIFFINAGYAIYPRGVYAYDIEKKKITKKFEVGTQIWKLEFSDITSNGENEIVLFTSAPGNMKKATGIHDHTKWLIVLNKHFKPIFNPVPFGGFSGPALPFVIKNGKTKNILVFYQQFLDSKKIFNNLLFNSKGEMIDSNKNFPNRIRGPIRLKENGEDIFYTTDYNGKLIKADSKLRIIKTADSFDNNILFSDSLNIKVDNHTVLLAKGFEHIYLISSVSLNLLAKFKFDESIIISRNFYSVKLNGKNKPAQLSITDSKHNYLFSIVENKLYSYLPLVFIGTGLISFFLFYAFHSILTFFSTYAKYFSYSLNRSSKGVALINSNGKIFYSNKNFVKFLKLPPKIENGKSYKNIFGKSKNVLSAIEEAFNNQSKVKRELQISSPTHQFEGEITITPFTSFIGFTYAYLIEIADYTEALLTDRGKVWGATLQRIAHEIKTPLSGINLGLNTLNDKLNKETNKYTDDILQIQNEVDRIKALTKNFLLFSNMEKPNFTKIQLGKLLKDAVCVFESYLKSGIELNIQEVDYTILGDELQLKQLFHVIIENAIDACGGVGVIDVRCEYQDVRYGYQDVRLKSEKGKNKIEDGLSLQPMSSNRNPEGEISKYVIVTISDNGKGLTDEELSKIFEPYFTTKKDGTGIGLAIAKKIIADHKGKIEIESELGVGTKVFIYLQAI